MSHFPRWPAPLFGGLVEPTSTWTLTGESRMHASLNTWRSAAVPAALTTLALGCQPQDATEPSAVAAEPGGAAAGITKARSTLPEFDPSNFVRGVDNPLFPLPLGRRLIYQANDDGEPSRV